MTGQNGLTLREQYNMPIYITWEADKSGHVVSDLLGANVWFIVVNDRQLKV